VAPRARTPTQVATSGFGEALISGERSGLGDVLGVAGFRNFWLGFAFSGIGDAMTKTALVWYVFARTGSAVDVGLLLLAYAGPVTIGGLVAGHLLDRFDRRKVMLLDSLVRCAVVASVPIAAAAGRLTLAHVYLVAGVYGFLFMISLAGAPSVIPSLVSDAQLNAANSLETLAFTLQGVVGPAIAGVLIAGIGAPYVLVVDAVSYLAFAAALARIELHPGAPETAPSESDQSPYRMQDAVTLLLRSPVLLATTLMFMSFNAGTGFLQVWLPIQAKTLDATHGAQLYGALFALMAAGETIGALGAARFAAGRSEGRLICGAQTLAGLSLAPALAATSVWSTAPALFFCGFFSAPMTAWAQTLRMRIIPPPLRGRSFALLRTLMQASAPAFSGIGGALFALIGLRALLALAVGLTTVPGLLGTRVRELVRPGGPHTAGSGLPVDPVEPTLPTDPAAPAQ
jgi:MFS family permease